MTGAGSFSKQRHDRFATYARRAAGVLIRPAICLTDPTRIRLVYKNTGTGFDTTPIQWSTPTPDVGARGLFTSAQANDSWGYWSTLDIDGDAVIDLVNTAPDGSVGQFGFPAAPVWRVYRGQ